MINQRNKMEKKDWMNKRIDWCHEYCYEKALQHEIDPIFHGTCHEDCHDDSCTFVHGEYGD